MLATLDGEAEFVLNEIPQSHALRLGDCEFVGVDLGIAGLCPGVREK